MNAQYNSYFYNKYLSRALFQIILVISLQNIRIKAYRNNHNLKYIYEVSYVENDRFLQ